jgi:hypothetical protein
MARIIVLSIADNTVAEQLAKDLLREVPKRAWLRLPGVKIEAMIARPTVACKGHRQPGRIKPLGEFTRTQRFGWFVCATCKRPAKAVVQRFVDNMLGGSNNLLPELTGGEPRQPPWLTTEAIRVVQRFQSIGRP